MRIRCPYCGRICKITHNKTVTEKVHDIYAQCSNPKCAARSVFILSHSHDLTPPADTLTDAMSEIIAHMDPDTRKDLVQRYGT